MPEAFEIGDLGFIVRRPDGESIQAAIDAACGSDDPEKIGRRALGPVFLPSGTYKITKPLSVTSVYFLHFYGSGRGLTKLYPVGEMDSVLDLNGVAFGSFRDFLIEGDSHNESIDDVIKYYWNPATSACSSAGNIFRNIQIQDVRCKTGFRIGLPASAAQVDTTSYENINVAGLWLLGEDTWWQAGFVVGTGAYGNNIIHSFWNAGATRWKSGFQVDATHFLLVGGSLGLNDIDFACNQLSYFSVQGVRCEDSRRLLTNGIGPTEAPANFSLADIVVGTTKLDPDGGLIQWFGINGNLTLRNIQVSVWAKNPCIIAIPWKGLSLTVDGLTCANTLNGFLSGLTDKVVYRIDGFTNLKPDGSGWESQVSGITNVPLPAGPPGPPGRDGAMGPPGPSVPNIVGKQGIAFAATTQAERNAIWPRRIGHLVGDENGVALVWNGATWKYLVTRSKL